MENHTPPSILGFENPAFQIIPQLVDVTVFILEDDALFQGKHGITNLEYFVAGKRGEPL
jgi:hypothetical protein